MIIYLFKTITAISILFCLFISIRAIIIGLIHQDATLLDRGLKILMFSFLIIFFSIIFLLFIPTQVSIILIFFISFIIPLLLFVKETNV